LVPSYLSVSIAWADSSRPTSEPAAERSATLRLDLAPQHLDLVRHQVRLLVLDGVAVAPHDDLAAERRLRTICAWICCHRRSTSGGD
jgi:hypothetical protein